MAKCQLSDGIIALHGAVSKSDGYYYRTNKTGTIYVCRKPRKNARTSTSAQLAIKQRFRLVHLQTATILHDPVLKSSYLKLFKRQKRYATLRGFIFATLYRKAFSPETSPKRHRSV